MSDLAVLPSADAVPVAGAVWAAPIRADDYLDVRDAAWGRLEAAGVVRYRPTDRSVHAWMPEAAAVLAVVVARFPGRYAWAGAVAA